MLGMRVAPLRPSPLRQGRSPAAAGPQRQRNAEKVGKDSVMTAIRFFLDGFFHGDSGFLTSGSIFR
jgi:hypothetical protein